MTDKTTNVRADELNYDKYSSKIYDDDICRSIPGYTELHKIIEKVVQEYLKKNRVKNILELGIGTGLTSEKILKHIPSASLTSIDFSKQMMAGAKKRLSKYKVNYIFGDYSKLKFGTGFDMVVSVIGIHHQNHAGKKKLFKEIFNSLKSDGIFIFGDLVTYCDKNKVSVNDARHYHHLVKNARNENALKEWAYHHKFLNLLTPIEYQIDWLKKSGFSCVEVKYEYMNTVLIVAKK
ncbi:MAG: class I SAM-dependent methyltransferase [Candidatus Aenigmatarchaeota archaeon]